MARTEGHTTAELRKEKTGGSLPGIGLNKAGEVKDALSGDAVFGKKMQQAIGKQFGEMTKTMRVEVNRESKNVVADIFEENGFYAEAAQIRGKDSDTNIFKRM